MTRGGRHLVKVEELFAELVVVALDTGLRLLDDARHLIRLERRLLTDAQEVEHSRDCRGGRGLKAAAGCGSGGDGSRGRRHAPLSPPNRRKIRSSSERKKCVEPGSP